MYAIIQNGAHQYKVQLGQFLKLEKLKLSPGESWKCQQVLVFQDKEGHLVTGKPYIEKAEVKARVIRHGKDKKVLVFKKKRRKGYRRTKGHRQEFTEIYVESLSDPEGKLLEKKRPLPRKTQNETSVQKVEKNKQEK